MAIRPNDVKEGKRKQSKSSNEYYFIVKYYCKDSDLHIKCQERENLPNINTEQILNYFNIQNQVIDPSLLQAP